MSAVTRGSDVLSLPALTCAALAAALAVPLTLLLAALGQGVGSWLGGCEWIGLSVPLDRPVWALVNQPELSFGARRAAFGYWLGSLLLPALVGGLSLPFVPRRRSVAAELFMVQLSWACLVVGLAWLPLLDRGDGHLARWLLIHRLPAPLLWLAPVGAAALAAIPTLRLLAVAQVARRHPSRLLRLALVALHLGLPVVAWVSLASLLGGRFLLQPTVAAALPLLAALVLAAVRYPAPWVHGLEEVGAMSFVKLAVAVVAVAGALWVAGRPVAPGARGGVLWGPPTAVNNIRPWIAPAPLYRGSLTPTSMDAL